MAFFLHSHKGDFFVCLGIRVAVLEIVQIGVVFLKFISVSFQFFQVFVPLSQRWFLFFRVRGSAACSRALCNSPAISVSMEGVNSIPSLFSEAFPEQWRHLLGLAGHWFSSSGVHGYVQQSFAIKIYLLALDSIFVPPIYSTYRLMKPLDESRSTFWVNTSLISFFTRLRKR